jgi:hypothetical protein
MKPPTIGLKPEEVSIATLASQVKILVPEGRSLCQCGPSAQIFILALRATYSKRRQGKVSHRNPSSVRVPDISQQSATAEVNQVSSRVSNIEGFDERIR